MDVSGLRERSCVTGPIVLVACRECLMHVHIYLTMLGCAVIASGCQPAESMSSGQSLASAMSVVCPTEPNAASLMIEKFSLTEENLTLEYRVTNVSSHDIWICTTQSAFADGNDPPTADVRITDETLWIQQRANVGPQNAIVEGMACVGYQRLSPGQTRLRAILLWRPIQSYSLVYSPPSRGFAETVLNRVVVQVGYFDEDLPALMQRHVVERYGANGPTGAVDAVTFCARLYKREPNIVPIPYLKQDRWEGLALEKSVTATIANIAIPAIWGIPMPQPTR
jgi:hypothetical protein